MIDRTRYLVSKVNCTLMEDINLNFPGALTNKGNKRQPI